MLQYPSRVLFSTLMSKQRTNELRCVKATEDFFASKPWEDFSDIKSFTLAAHVAHTSGPEFHRCYYACAIDCYTYTIPGLYLWMIFYSTSMHLQQHYRHVQYCFCLTFSTSQYLGINYNWTTLSLGLAGSSIPQRVWYPYLRTNCRNSGTCYPSCALLVSSLDKTLKS